MIERKGTVGWSISRRVRGAGQGGATREMDGTIVLDAIGFGLLFEEVRAQDSVHAPKHRPGPGLPQAAGVFLEPARRGLDGIRLPRVSSRPLMRTTLEIERLLLRPFSLDDVSVVARLAGDRSIADTTISVPHPLSETQARDWLLARMARARSGGEVSFAITRKAGPLVGAIALRDIEREHEKAELGFWIGVEYGGTGYATEAARAVIRFGFESLHLNRIYAHHMVRNPASGRVLGKAGMRPEGLLRQAVRKWGVFEDVVLCAILRSDWEGRATAANVPASTP
jgi:[ribosomal protein S5]-alanine N-acetyltransferase